MNESTLALLVPFGLFLLIGLSLRMLLGYFAKKNGETQQTLRLALEKGADVPAELIESLSANNSHPQEDLRRGIVWTAVAVGLGLIGLLTPDPSNHAFMGTLAAAAIPFAIGVAYFAMHYLAKPQAH
ncbi:hypothetical protein JF535_05885 [Microbulbifer salipaludis]|uniref:DUF6249 domain-containing protein n=1 Tax=Microbulbifer salipaludis TaxID=187980 RepID=A0ABS3E551_9GAMM|nr:DUF6249 domain-containing protein [Microbulbifer salipaludis]MBN8430382.1 hypothetical protein [Microbulbifer salipaludis]